MPRQSWRAVVMPHLLEAGRGDVIAPSIQIEEASVAIVGKSPGTLHDFSLSI